MWKSRSPRVLTLVVIALALLASIPAAQAHRGTATKTVTKAWSARWPTVPRRQRVSLERIAAPAGTIKRISVYVNGINLGPQEAYATIVACAHRGPSFAYWSKLVAGSNMYLLVVLETGECVQGSTVAGKLARVKVVVSYVPYAR